MSPSGKAHDTCNICLTLGAGSRRLFSLVSSLLSSEASAIQPAIIVRRMEKERQRTHANLQYIACSKGSVFEPVEDAIPRDGLVEEIKKLITPAGDQKFALLLLESMAPGR